MPSWPAGERADRPPEMSPLAVVTGASSGIGLELARLLARDGYRLLLIARDQERLAAAGDLVARASGGRAVVEVETVDLGDLPSVEALCRRVQELAPEILVNAAGFGTYGAFAETDGGRDAAMIATNVTALTLLTKAVLPGMLARRRGRVLNVASTAAFAPGPFAAVYAATKAFVLSLSEAVAEEARGSGVTVTALCPGPTETGFAARAGMGATRIFLGPVSTAAEVAEAGYRAMLAERRVEVVGLANRLLVFSVRLSPRRLVARMSRRVLSKAPPAL